MQIGILHFHCQNKAQYIYLVTGSSPGISLSKIGIKTAYQPPPPDSTKGEALHTTYNLFFLVIPLQEILICNNNIL